MSYLIIKMRLYTIGKEVETYVSQPQ